MDVIVDTALEEFLTEATHLWDACAQNIRDQVSDGVWNTTFRHAEPHSVADGELVLSVPSNWVKDRIEGRYYQLVSEALAEISGEPIQMTVEVDASSAPADDLVDIDLTRETVPGPGARVAPPQPTIIADPPNSDLNVKYTFDTFITGASNRFAHAAALSVAEKPARSYNPLFIHGDAGLGKTHLLQAIGNYVGDHYPDQSVLYVSTEKFLNEFVEAIRSNSRADFKRRYRNIDVLLVDDIQFLEGKEGLQEEFFHTFNTLYQANKQIVLSSDRSPDAISTLEDRLRSRFKMGLITDIQPPELETRLAILRMRAEYETQPMPPDVLEFIASNVKDNIRELEGALIRVSAYASLNDRTLDVDLAREVLRDLLASSAPKPITIDRIIDATCEMFTFTREELVGQRRHRPLVTSRQIAMYVVREMTDLSYPAIAREFGGRDHTTVIHAVEKISRLMAERRQIYDQVTDLMQTVRRG